MEKVSKRKRRSKATIATLKVIFVLAVFGAVGGYIWSSDYYRASVTALEALESGEVNERGDIVFDVEGTDKGVIIYPGGKVDEKAYALLAKSISEQGYDAYVAKMPLRLAILGIGRAERIMEENTEVNEWVMVGHSLGGVAASRFIVKDPHGIKGLVLLGSYPDDKTDLASAGIKVHSLIGTEDRIVDRAALGAADKRLGKDFVKVDVQGGNHSYFANYGVQDGDGEAAIGYGIQQSLVLKAVSDIFASEPSGE
ncbi:alpha/beta hydrolase [Youngiibacter fragilis]|uniref:Alpha/beta hydrolase fold-5 domain-containing protein n=1 Tax=Youngiibacter fragilis 232.1 TaxID=994573 RepID=V7HYF2_9CLOT|nr:alpha/beta hydrolase [Youngiibacter fragilis]ETA79010.1 hypothetical protein T472_0219410 [Youngiibacter fragilis 232.1]